MKRKYPSGLIFIIGILLIAVVLVLVLRMRGVFNHGSSTEKVSDGFGLFGEGDAVLPCWWKICLGTQMPRTELENLISGDSQISYYSYSLDAEYASFVYSSTDGQKIVWAHFPTHSDLNNILVSTRGEYTVSYSELLEKYGYPSYVGIAMNAYDPGAELYLYYPNLSAYFGTENMGIVNNKIKLNKNTNISFLLLTTRDMSGSWVNINSWVKRNILDSYRVD